MKAHPLSITLALILSVGAYVFVVQPFAADHHKDKAAIEAANKKFVAAFNGGSGAAVAALYTADAKLYPPNSEIAVGTEAITELWQAFIDAGLGTLELEIQEVERLGDAMFEASKYRIVGEDGTVVDHGKYVVIWKKDAGKWKLHHDIWNTSVPLEPASDM